MPLNLQLFFSSIVAIASVSAALAQPTITVTPSTTAVQETSQPTPNVDSGYKLGPDDRITINALHAEEISGKPLQIDGTGAVNLPMVGRVVLGGLTVPQAESAIAASLKVYIERPLVTVNVTEYQSQPVSVMGEVTTPGQYQIKGRKTIVDMLSMAGGLRPSSGHVVRITRRLENGRLPLANATDAPSGQFTTAELKIKDLMESKNPADNILVQAHDVITVPKAEMVYVLGEVNKAGGFVLNDQENLTVMQALALAGGYTSKASTAHAKILCAAEGGAGSRKEMDVDLRKILQNQAKDVPIHAQDILFIPTNTAKNVTIRVLETLIQTASGVVIWRSARY